MEVWLLINFIMAIVVGAIANTKKRSWLGWGFYGLIIWPVAIIHIACAGPLKVAASAEEADAMAAERMAREAEEAREASRLPCPFCAEKILPAAKVCPHCQRDLAEGWAGAPA